MTSRSMPGSRPEVGSSRKISDGLVSSSRATETRLRWPPESEVTFLSLWMSSLSSAQHLVDPGLALGLGGVAGEAELGRVLEGLA